VTRNISEQSIGDITTAGPVERNDTPTPRLPLQLGRLRDFLAFDEKAQVSGLFLSAGRHPATAGASHGSDGAIDLGGNVAQREAVLAVAAAIRCRRALKSDAVDYLHACADASPRPALSGRVCGPLQAQSARITVGSSPATEGSAIRAGLANKYP
jgi:hypothetical protein